MTAFTHNRGPLDRQMTDQEYRAFSRIVLRSSLPGNQKLLVLGVAVETDENGEAKMGAEGMKTVCSVHKNHTVFVAKKAVAESGIGIISTVSESGKANRYRVMPLDVVSSIIEAYNTRKESGEPMPEKDMGTHAGKGHGFDVTHAEKGHGGHDQKRHGCHAGKGHGSQAPLRARIENPSGLLFSEEDNKNTPLPPKTPTKATALAAFNAYNETALRCGLPQAAKLTPDRQRKILARLRDYGLDGWLRALGNIEKSAFLTGGTDHGFRADLDFVCQAKSFGKLHDGGYGNGRHRNPSQANQDPKERADIHDEWARARQVTEALNE